MINITKMTQLLFDGSIQIQAVASLAGVRAGTLASYRRKSKALGDMPLAMAIAVSKVASDDDVLAEARALSKLAPKRIETQVKQAVLVKELQQQIATEQQVPNSTEFVHYHQVVQYFGSWHNFLAAQGIADTVIKQPRQSKLDKQQLIADFIQQAADLGHLPKSYEYRHYAAAKRLFGSWADFMTAIKIE